MSWRQLRSGRAIQIIGTNDFRSNSKAIHFRNMVVTEFQRIRANASQQKSELITISSSRLSGGYSRLQSIYRNINVEDMIKYDDSVILMCDDALRQVENIENYLNAEVPWKMRKKVRERMLEKILTSSRVKLNRLALPKGIKNE